MLVFMLGCGGKPEPARPEAPDTGETRDSHETRESAVELETGESGRDSGDCVTTPWYVDADGDGHGAGVAVDACTWPGTGWVDNAADCDDGDAEVSPEAVWESCTEGIDRNCDGVVNGVDEGVCDVALGHDRVIEGDRSWFGSGFSWMEDVDGDGRSDLLVGSPYYHCAGPGRALLFLAEAFSDADANTDAAALTIEGPWEGCFGYSVADAGDIDGDGVSDFIVGEPQDARYNSDWTSSDLGHAYMFMAADLLGGSAFTEADGVDWPGGVESYDAFGQWVGPVGDVDGDGLADVFGSGYYARVLTAASILSGSTGDDIGLPDPVETDYLRTTGDADGDGRDDVATDGSIVFGDSLTPGTDVAPADVDYRFRGGEPGVSVSAGAIAADADGDGLADVIARGFSDIDGRLYILIFRYAGISAEGAGASSFDDASVQLELEGRWSVTDPAMPGDFDGDAIPDIVGRDTVDTVQGLTIISGTSVPSSGVVELGTWDRRAVWGEEGIGAVELDGDADGDGRADMLLAMDSTMYLVFGW